MRLAACIKCHQCTREARVLSEVANPQIPNSGEPSKHFCSQGCYQTYIMSEKVGRKEVEEQMVKLVEAGLQFSLEECQKKAQAEFIFFLHTMRALSECEILKLILSRENLVPKLQSLKTDQNKRNFTDFLFSTDIIKLALNIQMQPDRVNFIVSRIWEIAAEAREKIMGIEDELDDHIDTVDGDIFQAIAKNTIDVILELGSDRISLKKSTESEKVKASASSQTSSYLKEGAASKDFASRQDMTRLQFVALEEESLKKMSVTVRDNGDILRKFTFLSSQEDFSDITVQMLAEKLCSEELYPTIDFIFLKRYPVSLPGRFLNQEKRISVIDFEENKWFNLPEDLLIARSVRPGSYYNPAVHFILNFHLSEENFVRAFDYFFYLQSPAEGPRLLELVAKLLTGDCLPKTSRANIKLMIPKFEEELRALRDLCVSHMADHKILSIEILPCHIVFETMEEETIYMDDELAYAKTCEEEIRSEKFLLNLAAHSGIDHVSLRLAFQSMLSDPQLSLLDEDRANKLRVLRCMRVAQLLSSSKGQNINLNRLSFIFAPHRNKYLAARNNHTHSAQRNLKGTKVFEYDVSPDPGNYLIKLIGNTTLPSILCIKHDFSHSGNNLLQLLLRPEIVLNSRAKYQLKAVLETEYDPRGVCSCVSIKGDAITNQSNFAVISSRFLEGRPPKVLHLFFELQTYWLLLESTAS